MNTATLVQKLWNYCNVLRDDGMSDGDYPRLRGDRLLQLTCLLCLKPVGRAVPAVVVVQRIVPRAGGT